MADRPVGVVLMAYGSPRDPEDIERYYTDIRRGRPPTPEQLADLRRRYEAIGGISPLTERTEGQRRAIAGHLDALAPGHYEVVLGLKHAPPTIEDAVEQLAGNGIRQIVGLVLAPHYSAMSVGGYLERLRATAAPHGLEVVGIETWATEPALIGFLTQAVTAGLRAMPSRTTVVFTAHSLPARIVDNGDPYPDELTGTAAAVAAGAGLTERPSAPTEPSVRWTTAWQSAGRTPEPWLGPDIGELIDDLAGAPDVDGILVCACGFVSDHLEVLYDLDVDARVRAVDAGLEFHRTACVNDDAAVMQALATRIHAASTGAEP